jgi:hypothetical protein
MIKKLFYEDVIDTKLYIVLWGNKDINTIDDEQVRTYWEYIDEDRLIMLNMDEIKTQKVFIKTLSHELLHFVWYNLRRKGIEHVFLTEEIYCYLYDFYFWQIRERINKNKIFKKLK